jgi:hypothetical protein
MNCATGTRRAASRRLILPPFRRHPAETVTDPDATREMAAVLTRVGLRDKMVVRTGVVRPAQR